MGCIVIKEYSERELLSIMSGTELPQTDNDNSFSRLFVRDGYVYKLFDMLEPRSKKVLDELGGVLNYTDDFGERIACPSQMISFNNRLVGYRMPYFEGIMLGKYMETYPGIVKMNEIFINLEETVSMLGSKVCVGDLHAGNVIWDGENTYLIDPDGFALAGGDCNACPLLGLEATPSWLCKNDEHIIAGHLSDYGCMLNLYVSFILDGIMLFHMVPKVYNAYTDYLNQFDSCRPMAMALKAFQNKIVYDWREIAVISSEDARQCTFDCFCRSKYYLDLLGGLRL